MSSLDYNNIEGQLNKLRLKLNEPWLKMHTPIPDLLYHYTTAEGLIGIFTSRKLWATNINYLNDSSEVSYAAGIVRDELSRIHEHTDSEVIRELMRRAHIGFNEFEWLSDLYIICFCEEGDLLSQWRGYGAMGGGYALGFSAKSLGGSQDGESILRLRRVIYDRDTQINLIKDTLKETCDLLLTTLREIGRCDVKDVRNIIARFCGEFWVTLSEFLFCFKHPTFAEEKEWRVIYKTSDYTYVDKVNFRGLRGSIVPYVELNFSSSVPTATLPIRKIVHGPTLNPLLTEKSLRLLLMKNKYDPLPEIKSSNVPFRL